MKIIVWILLKETCVTSFQQLIGQILSRELVTFFSVGIIIVIHNHGYALLYFVLLCYLRASRKIPVSFQYRFSS